MAGKQDKLRVIAAIQPLRVAFFVRKDSDMKTLADAKGKRFPLGFSAMRTNDDLALASLAAVGLTPRDVRPVMVPNVVRSADDFMSGAADLFYFALGAGKVNEADASVGGIRALTLPNTPAALAAARKIAPPIYFTQAKPRPGLAGVTEEITTMTFDNVLVAGAHVRDAGGRARARRDGEEQGGHGDHGAVAQRVRPRRLLQGVGDPAITPAPSPGTRRTTSSRKSRTDPRRHENP